MLAIGVGRHTWRVKFKAFYPNDLYRWMVNMPTVVNLREESDELYSANGIEDKQIKLAIINLGFRSD
jgi:hypothetical protein